MLFRSLDALRVLGMLNDIEPPLTLERFEVSGLDLFSDGQFQSVYLFAVADLLTQLNCVAPLDEPDALLHRQMHYGTIALEWDELEFIVNLDGEAVRIKRFAV